MSCSDERYKNDKKIMMMLEKLHIDISLLEMTCFLETGICNKPMKVEEYLLINNIDKSINADNKKETLFNGLHYDENVWNIYQSIFSENR